MIALAILYIVSSVLSFSYKAGDVMKYNVVTETNVVSVRNGREEKSTSYKTNCLATIQVQSVDSKGNHMRMIVSDAHGSVSDGSKTEKTQDDSIQQNDYARPMLFTQKSDGTITDVKADKLDTDAHIAFKTGIVNALHTKLSGNSNGYEQKIVMDTKGKHAEYFKTRNTGLKTIIDSFYTENDFVEFSDSRLTADMIGLDGARTITLENGLISEANHKETVVLSGKDVIQKSFIKTAATGYDDEIIEVKAVGSVEIKIVSVANEKVRVNADQTEIVYQYNAEWYNKREKGKVVEIKTKKVGAWTDSCPAVLNVCKGLENAWSIGNTQAGLQLSVKVLAGVSSGCKDAKRSYQIGAYAHVDVLLLGHKIDAANALVEYGSVNGQKLKNAIQLTVASKSVYNKPIPWLDCLQHTQNLINVSVPIPFVYVIPIAVVTITFDLGLKFGFSTDFTAKVCVMELYGQIGLKPKGTAAAMAKAEVNAVVARAGIELNAGIIETFDPTAYVDGNLCRVGFFIHSITDPLFAKFIGWYQLRAVSLKGVAWGTRHEQVFWQWSLPPTTITILDKWFGA